MSIDTVILSTNVHDLIRDMIEKIWISKPSFEIIDNKIVQNNPTLNELGTDTILMNMQSFCFS